MAGRDPEGLVSFEAAGEKFTAVFGFRAMKHVEAHYDLPFMKVLSATMPALAPGDAGDQAKVMAAAMNVRMTDVFVLFGATLLKHHPDLLESEIEEIADAMGTDKVGEVIGLTIAAALAKEDGKKPPANPPNRRARRSAKTG